MKITKQNYREMEITIASIKGGGAVDGAYEHLAKLAQAQPLQGTDPHVIEAARIFGVKEKDVTPDQRRQAKAYMLGRYYGMGSRKVTGMLKGGKS
jgi:hypothetical protein